MDNRFLKEPEDTFFALDILCLSHLRWDFVFQRPQHIMTRFSKHHRVFFYEEPIEQDVSKPSLDVRPKGNHLLTVTPIIPSRSTQYQRKAFQRKLLSQVVSLHRIKNPILWFYTPMSLEFVAQMNGSMTVYDCMDELSMFRSAPSEIKARETELFIKADIVFTGGRSLFEEKRKKHRNVYEFPSSIDFAHFFKARGIREEPEDQMNIPRPRIGYFGVIDERVDYDLVLKIAEARRDWQIVMVGPVAKVEENDLPRRQNIHYLGKKDYELLPKYVSGWDVAMLPFARNDATRYISPTKTPEYLAAGMQVVSTPIRDVVTPYAEKGFVSVARNAEGFVTEIEKALELRGCFSNWQDRVDEWLSRNSWDKTVERMRHLLKQTYFEKNSEKIGANLAHREPA